MKGRFRVKQWQREYKMEYALLVNTEKKLFEFEFEKNTFHSKVLKRHFSAHK